MRTAREERGRRRLHTRRLSEPGQARGTGGGGVPPRGLMFSFYGICYLPPARYPGSSGAAPGGPTTGLALVSPAECRLSSSRSTAFLFRPHRANTPGEIEGLSPISPGTPESRRSLCKYLSWPQK